MWVLLSSGFIPWVYLALDFLINSSCDILATFRLTTSFLVVTAGNQLIDINYVIVRKKILPILLGVFNCKTKEKWKEFL